MEHMHVMGIVITIIMGLGWGSFATMATYRIPRGMPWIGDKPRCFMCKTPLNILDYFSIISFFIHRGKCRHCGGEYEENISYFITELGITVLFVLCYLEYNFGDHFVLLTSLVVATIITGTIDAEHKKIPAKPLIALLIIGVAWRVFIDQTFYGVIYGAFAGAIVAVALRAIYFHSIGKPEVARDYTTWQHEDRFIGPGFEYVKLAAICGVWLNFPHLAVFFVVSLITIALWNAVYRQSLRIGSVMVGYLTLFCMYPEVPDALWSYALSLM